MAFKMPPPNSTSIPVPRGTVDRGTTVRELDATTTPTGRPTLGPEAGLFGGTLPPSRTGTEKRAQTEGDARRFESFHPNERQPGPFVLGEQGTGAMPIHPLPRFAAEIFAKMLRGPQR